MHSYYYINSQLIVIEINSKIKFGGIQSKMKKILLTSTTAIAASILGISLANQSLTSAKASVVENDRQVYTVHKTTKVYNKYAHGKKTGQILKANSSWKVIRTAYDKKDNKWYDLGKNQWVKAEKEIKPLAVSQSTPVNTNANNTNHNKYSVQNTQASVSQSYSSNSNSSEASAKSFIASRESGGSYSARNGSLIGKYQLSASYLNGDYSASNQEKAADNYVHSRYGSWSAAKSFWQQNGWY